MITIFKEMLMDYRIVPGKGFVTIERKVAKLFMGFPYSVKWYPVTRQVMWAGGLVNATRNFSNKVSATYFINHELASVGSKMKKQ